MQSPNSERKFYFGGSAIQNNLQNNFIRTSKYTPVNFFPKCLIYEFTQLSNLYFLMISILESIPAVSPSHNPGAAWVPLAFVVGVSMLREAIEDKQRSKQDHEINSTLCLVYRAGQWVKITWGQIQVGELILLEDEQVFPADAILIESGIGNGVAFVETSSLDGQKSLKRKKSLEKTVGCFKREEQICRIEGQVRCENPSESFNSFNGILNYSNEQFKLSIDQLILRGSKLKSSFWALAVVAYTGRDTKIMQGTETHKLKKSSVDQRMNKMICAILIFQFACSLTCSILAMVYNSKEYSKYWYLKIETNPIVDGFISFFTYIALTNTMIPISLLVSLEIVRYCQAYFIKKDELMALNKQYPKVMNNSLNEELGQIQHAFIDKTGTLTTNNLLLKELVVGNYDIFSEEKQKEQFGILTIYDDNSIDIIKEINVFEEVNTYFWLAIILCHDLITYNVTTPEDQILLEEAEKRGYKYLSSKNNDIEVSIKGTTIQFKLLKFLPFDHQRKMMSIVVRDQSQIYFFSKGAEKEIKSHLNLNVSQPFLINQVITPSLRQIYVGFKLISIDMWEVYKYSPGELELNQYLLGSVGLEEILQADLEFVFESFTKAKIKVWILTGDTVDNAENVARDCYLIDKNFKVIKFLEPNQKGGVVETIDQLKAIKRKKAILMEGIQCLDNLNIVNDCEVVIIGKLTPAEKVYIVQLVKRETKQITMAIGDGANDVGMIQEADVGIAIAGDRAEIAGDFVIPEFKAIWRLIFVHGRWNYIRTTEMILYFFYKNLVFAMPQFYFAFFTTYSGQSVFDAWYIALYNILFTACPLLIRAVLEQDIYYIQKKELNLDEVKQIPFNVNHNKPDDDSTKDQTSSNIGNSFIFEGFAENKTLKKLYPKLYYISQTNYIFTYKNFCFNCVQAVINSLVAFAIIWMLKGSNKCILNKDGYTQDIWTLSIMLYTSIIIIVNVKLAVQTKFITSLYMFGVIFLSFGIYFAIMFIFDSIPFLQLYKMSSAQIDQGDIYMVVLFCVSFTFVGDYLLRQIFNAYAENLLQVIEKLFRRNQLDYELERIEKMNWKGEVIQDEKLKYEEFSSEQVNNYLMNFNMDHDQDRMDLIQQQNRLEEKEKIINQLDQQEEDEKQ